MSPTPRTLGKSSAFLYRESPTPLAFFEVPDRFANANQLSVGQGRSVFHYNCRADFWSRTSVGTVSSLPRRKPSYDRGIFLTV